MAISSDELTARHRAVLGAFVLRARRIEAHSLAADKKALLQLASGRMTVQFRQDEQKAYMTRVLPPEEQLESAAARVRPLVLEKEQTHYAKVLAALGYFARGNDEFTEILRRIRGGWDKTRPDSKSHLGSYTQIQNAEGVESPMLSDIELAYAYIYGDVVHHDGDRLLRTQMFGVENRYQAAAPIVARLMLLTITLLNLTKKIRDAGLFELHADLFTEEVVVTETTFRNETRVWIAPIGTPPPAEMGEAFSEEWAEFVTRLPSADDSAEASK